MALHKPYGGNIRSEQVLHMELCGHAPIFVRFQTETGNGRVTLCRPVRNLWKLEINKINK